MTDKSFAICAACGLVQQIGFVVDGKIVEPDPTPQAEFYRDSAGRMYCTQECLVHGLGPEENSQRSELSVEDRSAMVAGIMSAKITTMTIKPTRRLRRILYYKKEIV